MNTPINYIIRTVSNKRHTSSMLIFHLWIIPSRCCCWYVHITASVVRVVSILSWWSYWLFIRPPVRASTRSSYSYWISHHHRPSEIYIYMIYLFMLTTTTSSRLLSPSSSRRRLNEWISSLSRWRFLFRRCFDGSAAIVPMNSLLSVSVYHYLSIHPNIS